MKYKMQKIMAIMLTLILTGVNLITTANAVIAASEDDLSKQTNQTNHANVEFDSYFEGNVHNKTFEIDKQDAKIYMKLNIKNAGYLTNGTVKINDANFQVNTSNLKNDKIQSVGENEIRLQQINNGEEVVIEVPVKMLEAEIVNQNVFSQTSKIKFTGTYVDANGKAKQIEKEIINQIQWEGKAQAELKSEISKYLPYQIGEEYGVLVQAKVNSKVQNNSLPVSKSQIQINALTLEGLKPSEVKVVANSTIATNGKINGNDFNNDNYTYDEQKGIVTIITENKAANGKIAWNKNVQDEYLVTYLFKGEEIYNKVQEQLKNKIEINGTLTVSSKMDVYNATKTTVEKEIEQPYTLAEVKGELVDNYILNTANLSKGYLYANFDKKEKQETNFIERIVTKIDYAKVADFVEIETKQDNFLNSENEKSIANTYVKSIKIAKDIFIKMLGEEGKIAVTTVDGTSLGTIEKITDAQNQTVKEENGYYILNVTEAQVEQIKMKTTKPVTEGKLEINVEKAVKTEGSYTKNEMQTFTQLEVNASTNIAEKEQENAGKIELKEPVSKAEISIEEGKDNLSTILANKGVQIRAVLDTSNIYNALYKNPVIEIEMPSQVQKVDIKDVKLLLEDELKIKETKVEDRNGKKVIVIKLEGTQTKYSSELEDITNEQNVITKGANIVIQADIYVNKLTPSQKDTIKMYYTNENTNLYEKEEKITTKARNVSQTKGVATTGVSFVAPTGVITEGTIQTDASSQLASMADETKTATIANNTTAKTITIGGNIVNNYSNGIDKVVVLGRVPAKENLKIDSTQKLGSTFDTIMKTKIAINTTIDNSKVKVYYSTKLDATKDLTDSNNEWTQTPTDLSKVKSYLITVEGANIPAQTQFTFSYQAEIPEKLTHNQTTYQMYKVYYENQASVATMQETKTSPILGLTTGEGPEIEAKLTASVPENATINLGQTIRFYVDVTNTSKVDAKNVKVKVVRPTLVWTNTENGETRDGISFAEFDEYTNSYEINKAKEKIINVDTVKAGETKRVDYELYVGEYTFTTTNSEAMQNKITVIADDIDNEIDSNNYNFTIQSGNLYIVNGVSTREKEVHNPGDIITYTIEMHSILDIAKNVVVTVPLPTGAKFLDAYVKDIDGNKVDTNITTGQNIVANMGDIDILKYLVVQYQLGENSNSIISTKVTATIEGDKQYYSNERFIYTESSSTMTGKQLSPDKTNVKEEEEFYYQFDLKTSGKNGITNCIIEDSLPAELTYLNSSIAVVPDSGEAYTGYAYASVKDGKLTLKMNTLPGNATVHIKVNVKGRLLDGNTSEQKLVNTAKVYADNIAEINLGSVTSYLEYNSDVHGGTGENPPPQQNRYKITGTAWIDSNKNGQREQEEQVLPNIEVMLVSKITNDIVTDETTKQPKTVKTNEKGEYEFTNLLSADYIVVFLYDASKYNVTTYQKEGISQSENSDVVSMLITMNGEKRYAAVSDTIKVTSQSVRDIDIGLYVAEKFDLRLDKTISKITLTTPTIGTKAYTYNNSKLEKIEVLAKNVDKSNIIVEYKIKVTNEGQIAGYAKKLVDYLPEGVKFSTELNKDWYVSEKNSSVYNTSLANEKLEPGQSKEVTLIVSVPITSKNIGQVVNNNAEIYESYNEQGLPDMDSTAGNKAENEDDMSKADIVLSIVTGKIVMYVTLTIVVMGILIAGIIIIRKKVLKKK